MLRGALADTC